MLDARQLKTDPAAVAAKLTARNYALDIDKFQSLEAARHDAQQRAEKLQAERNRVSKAIGVAKSKGEHAQGLIDSTAELGARLKTAQAELAAAQVALQQLLDEAPNLAHESVPVGKDETANEEIRRWGERARSTSRRATMWT